MKTLLYRASNLKHTITFLAFNIHSGSQFLAPMKNHRFLQYLFIIIIIIIIIIIFIIINFFIRVFSDYTEVVTTSLIPLDAIRPEICTLSLVLAVLRGLK